MSKKLELIPGFGVVVCDGSISGTYSATGSMKVKCRNTGEEIKICSVKQFFDPVTEAEIYSKMVTHLLDHELAEIRYAAGEGLDPHMHVGAFGIGEHTGKSVKAIDYDRKLVFFDPDGQCTFEEWDVSARNS